MNSITEYPLIAEGIIEQERLWDVLDLTVADLERELASPAYEMVEPVWVHEKKVMDAVEKVTGFGTEVGNIFEDLVMQLGRVPTVKEYCAAVLPEVELFWKADQCDGIEWGAEVIHAVNNRNIRAYKANINELHCVLALRELFPDWGIYSSDELDLLAGVDIVVETEKKRLFLHLYRNSKFSFIAYRKKQRRGGKKNTVGKFVRYYRDFEGDKSLMYEGNPAMTSDTTKFINGIPLFKLGWLENQLVLFDTFKQFGEPLENSGKLAYMEKYLRELQKTETTVGGV